MSQLTTHILDTSIGKPAKNVAVKLEQKVKDSWVKIGQGITNGDGRISDLLAADFVMPEGNYRLIFDTKKYFDEDSIETFYPSVTIEFLITDSSHYHVPLLLNPFGYSTYRGS